MPLIEKRYAEALIGLSVQKNTIDEYQQELLVIVELYKNLQEFRLFLLNPEIKTDNKKTVINNSFNGKVKKEIISFILLLLDKGRIRNLPGILIEYIKSADKIKNTMDITIISSIPLEDTQVSKIVEKYKTLFGSISAKIHLAIDSSLIGGVKVKIGDKVVDSSITGRLKNLREVLIES
jgi:F-type H+-transporting ATPase subunit delta